MARKFSISRKGFRKKRVRPEVGKEIQLKTKRGMVKTKIVNVMRDRIVLEKVQ